ncbi:MAG: glycosyltransferase family 4 protein [Pseudomonadota bacterium]
MKILLINHYAGSPGHGMEFRPYYLAREWVRAGHSVQIVASSFSHIRAVQPALAGKSMVEEQIDGINYRWYATGPYSGNGLGRVLNILSFLWALWRDASRLAGQFRPDVVIASSTYPMDIWPARRIAKLTGARLVFEVHDLWPLSPMELGGMSRWHPFIIVVQLAEDYAYRHADKVVSILPKTLEYMQSRGMAPHKFASVPNGIDAVEWETPADLPSGAAAAIAAVRALGGVLVGYAGTYGMANALDTLLDASCLLATQAQIVFVGTGPERNRLLARVRDEGLENVHILPPIPKATVPNFLAAIDIAYIGWKPNALYRFGISPNKLVDYMMSGKPIVHAVCAGNDPVSEYSCGITVSPGDPSAIARAVNRLISIGRSQREQMGQTGRQFVLSNLTYPVLAERFLNAIEG